MRGGGHCLQAKGSEGTGGGWPCLAGDRAEAEGTTQPIRNGVEAVPWGSKGKGRLACPAVGACLCSSSALLCPQS